MIAAMSENGVIGRRGGLPWHLPADLQHFRQLTEHHAVIMGRRTWEEIGRPLAHRRSIVITGNRRYEASEARVVHSIEEALAAARDDPEPFIIGGGSIYRQTMPLASRIYLTLVHAHLAGDTVFPAIPAEEWRLVKAEHRAAADRHACSLSFHRYERIAPA